MRRLMVLMGILAMNGVLAFAQQPPYGFSARHDHAVGSCQGKLIISHEGIRYETARKKDQRTWSYKDIQQVQLLSQKKLAIVTYEDEKLKLGTGKVFKFEILDGEISNDLYQFVLEQTSKPLVAKLPFVKAKPAYQIPAKHRHRLGGCQGTLLITADGVTYQTESRAESRTWRYRDIESIGPMDPFSLRITASESSYFYYTGKKDFNFVLKERIDERIYEYIWERIHKIGHLTPE